MQAVVDGSLIFGGLIIAAVATLIFWFGMEVGSDGVMVDCKLYGKHVERVQQIECKYSSTR